MPDITPAFAGSNATLLLVESAAGRTTRAAELGDAPYDVIRAQTVREICLLGTTLDPCIAILSDTIGLFSLCSSAQMVRENWPRARILILGSASDRLEDDLYDQALRHAADKTLFLSTLAMLCPQPSIQTGGTFKAWMESVSSPRFSSRPLVPPESDPTKMGSPLMHAALQRDLPASLHRYYPRR